MQQRYQQMMTYVAPTEALIQSVLQPPARPRRFLRPAAALLAACLLLAVSAAAVSTTAGHDLLYRLSPALAQAMTPVEKRSVSSGIELEMVSAQAEGDAARFLLALRDLEGNRLSGTPDLYDSCRIFIPFNSSQRCEWMGWQGDAAVFLITVTTLDGRDIPGGKITFRLSQILTGQETFSGVPVPLDLSGAGEAAWAEGEILGGSGAGYPQAAAGDTARVLAPQPPLFSLPGAALTGVGYVDGLLHLQTTFTDPAAPDDHGYFRLTGPDGQVWQEDYSIYTAGDDGCRRLDQVFSLSPETLADCTLTGEFVLGGTLLEGSWAVTFPCPAA